MNSYEWKTQDTLIAYNEAIDWMENRVVALQKGEAPECVWLLEHPPLYTMGTRGVRQDVLSPTALPVVETKRGGQVTYHGPGQRIVYLMLDLKTRKPDIKWYVSTLELWIIQVLKHFGIQGERRPERVGVWVQKKGVDHKIAALGVRVQKWVTSHGIALNIAPDLKPYEEIIPCGLKGTGVTSLKDLGLSVTLSEVDEILKKTFPFAP